MELVEWLRPFGNPAHLCLRPCSGTLLFCIQGTSGVACPRSQAGPQGVRLRMCLGTIPLGSQRVWVRACVLASVRAARVRVHMHCTSCACVCVQVYMYVR
eukprot:12213954-Alexandrium_andersonii.AAC.1